MCALLAWRRSGSTRRTASSPSAASAGDPRPRTATRRLRALHLFVEPVGRRRRTERRFGRFERKFGKAQMPDDADLDAVSAK